MYHVACYFNVPPEHHREFIDAALEDSDNSSASEAGTRRLELIRDDHDPNRFYLNEAYDDESAFEAHKNGPHFEQFFAVIGAFADGPEDIMTGTQIT